MIWCDLRWLLALGWIVMTTGCLGPTLQEVRQAEALYKLGLDQTEQGLYRQALAVLMQAQKLNSQSYWIEEALGVTLMRMQQSKLAQKHFLRALEIEPKSPRGWNNLGTAYMAFGEWPKAINAFHRALENILYETPCMAQMNLGWSYQRSNNPQKALLYLQQATNGCPRLCQGYRLFGMAALEQKKYEIANRSFRQLVSLCKKYPEGHYLYAQTLLAQRKYVEAVQSTRACVSLSEQLPRLQEACQQLLKQAQTKVAHYVP